MKLQLLHPPHPSATDDKLDAPLGLLYVAAAARQVGCDVVVTDFCGTGGIHKSLIEPADLYGITSYVCTMNLAEEIAELCRSVNPDAKIIGGGANLTGIYEQGEALPSFYDAVVIGAGERAICQIIKDYPSLASIYEYDLPRNLDEMELKIDYDLVDILSYHRKIDNQKSISILTSRGCPFRCAFCGLPKQSRIVRYRTPEAVAAEIKMIKDKYGITAFNFQDDTFIVDKKRVKKLCKLLEPLDISWRCLGRAGLDSLDDYKRMKDAGCKSISWGIESGSQYILDRMNKQVRVRDNYQIIEWAKSLDILDRVFILVGFPGETAKTLSETMEFVDKADPSQYLASTFQPYPGTDVAKNPLKYGVTKIYHDYSNYIQIKANGNGGDSNIDTLWHKREQMSAMLCDFKDWLNRRKRRGALQDYEKKLEIMK